MFRGKHAIMKEDDQLLDPSSIANLDYLRHKCGLVVCLVLVFFCRSSRVTNAQYINHVQELRLARLVDLNAAGEEDASVTNAVLGTRWPSNMLPHVTRALNTAIDRHARDGTLILQRYVCHRQRGRAAT